MKFDPLEFFKTHEKRFPILAGIAVRGLSIPPSEAECERTFSIIGRVHSKARNSLNGHHINQVVSLHQWLHMVAQNECIGSSRCQNHCYSISCCNFNVD
jgi:hypothetical protein